MVTLRCTTKLLKRLTAEKSPIEYQPSTTALGDWYCNLIQLSRNQAILCVSEKSYLMVLMPAAPFRQFGQRLSEWLHALLLDLAVPSHQITAEIDAMQTQCRDKTQSRVVLGVMNRMARDMEYYEEAYTGEPGYRFLEKRFSNEIFTGLSTLTPATESRKLLAERWGAR